MTSGHSPCPIRVSLRAGCKGPLSVALDAQSGRNVDVARSQRGAGTTASPCEAVVPTDALDCVATDEEQSFDRTIQLLLADSSQAQHRTRTDDPFLTMEVLYQLS